MGCRSDYLEDSPLEASGRLALKELDELLPVATALVIALRRESYPPAIPYKALIDALTAFSCNALEVLERVDSSSIKGNPAITAWKNRHMPTDLRRAAELQKEAEEILKRYGK